MTGAIDDEVVIAALVWLALAAPPDGVHHYRLAQRDVELVIHSRTEGALEIRDHLIAKDGDAVATLDYVLRPAAPLFRFTVVDAGFGGFGQGSAAKPEDVARALDFFVNGGTRQGGRPSARPPLIGERSDPSSYPRGLAVVARNAGDGVEIEVKGRRPVIDLIYSVGVTGRAMSEPIPGTATQFRNFTRFTLPQLAPGEGTVSHLRVKILPRITRQTDKGVTMVDERSSWRSELTQLGSGQAVDVLPTEDAERLTATISNTYVPIAEGSTWTHKRVQATELAFVAPPPAPASITVVTAAIDVPPDRAQFVSLALRALDEPVGTAVGSTVLGAAPEQVFPALPQPLTLPATRAEPAGLLKRALAATGGDRTIIVFTDRPAAIAQAAASLTFKHPLHVVSAPGPAPRGWSRVLGNQRPEAKLVERTGGIWIELADVGAPLDALWDHLVSPRFLDDVALTLNGAPFRPAAYLATVFETPGQTSGPTPPAVMALGSDLHAMLVSVGPNPGTSKRERWEVTGLAWSRRVRSRAEATEGYGPIRNLRVSPAIAKLPAPFRAAVEDYLSQIQDVLPDRPQAYIAP